MTSNRKLIYLTIVAVTLSIINLVWPYLGRSKTTSQDTSINTENTFKVSRAIDGDTIVLETGQKVRYIGIDSPENTSKDQKDKCISEQALNKNKELVEGKIVTLEKDISETDKFGRLLRYVYINGLFVNEYLVKEGYAEETAFPPDIKYLETFRTAEKEAKAKNKGMWGAFCNL